MSVDNTDTKHADCEFCAAHAVGFNIFTRLNYCADHQEAADCEHPESENGICNDCGAEVDWVARVFGYED